MGRGGGGGVKGSGEVRVMKGEDEGEETFYKGL